MRDNIETAFKQAMRDKDTMRLSTLRLIKAAIAERDIESRGGEDRGACDDAAIMALLAKMIKQREESARLYESGGRVELCEREHAEIEVIREFLPQPLSSEEVSAAVEQAVSDTGAQTLKDMGAVMARLRADYLGRMDFGAVGKQVKAQLSAG